MKDLGEAGEFLGLRITRNRSERTLNPSQTKYIDRLLERFGISSEKTIANPMQVHLPSPPLEASTIRQLKHHAVKLLNRWFGLWYALERTEDYAFLIGGGEVDWR